jgi:hypothetical protein
MAALGLFSAGAAPSFLEGDVGVVWFLLTMALAFVTLVFAYAAWFEHRWAWLFGLILQAITLAVALVNWIGGRSGPLGFLLQAGIAAAILYLLFTPQIKQVFRRR